MTMLVDTFIDPNVRRRIDAELAAAAIGGTAVKPSSS